MSAVSPFALTRAPLALAGLALLALAGCVGDRSDRLTLRDTDAPAVAAAASEEPTAVADALDAGETAEEPSEVPPDVTAEAADVLEVPVEPLAVAEPDPEVAARRPYPNVNAPLPTPEGPVLTPEEQASIGADLRERAARIAHGDGPLLRRMRQQTEALRERVGTLRDRGETPVACDADSAAADESCPQ